MPKQTLKTLRRRNKELGAAVASLQTIRQNEVSRRMEADTKYNDLKKSETQRRLVVLEQISRSGADMIMAMSYALRSYDHNL